MDAPLLWHIPLSHFSEKVRWALDYTRIPHHRRVLGPDYLTRAWRAGHVLVADDRFGRRTARTFPLLPPPQKN